MRRTGVGLVLAALGVAGCAGGGRPAADAACLPPGDSGQARVTELAGDFRLKLVNGQSGDSVAGTLRLVAQADSLKPMPEVPGAQIPLIGTTDVDVERVGGIRPGDLASTDPMRPGVAVVTATDQITIRFGAEANTRGRRSFDAAAFALFVAASDANGFQGRWISSVELTRVTGYFCATRIRE